MAQYEEIGNVNIWWFPEDFCQSRFGDYRKSGTNSCTLISLILADKVSKMPSLSQNVKELPEKAWDLIGDSINEGNIVYHDEISANLNINIPDAMAAIRSHHKINFLLEEWFFTQVGSDPLSPMIVGVELSRIFTTTLDAFKQVDGGNTPSQLFAAIVADCRTVMVSIDLRTSIAFIVDSHQHGNNAGAFFAQSDAHYISDLMFWFISMLDHIFSSHPAIFEISFLCAMPDIALRIPPAVKQHANNICKFKKSSKTA
ncbi:uncharacterized protein LOC6583767 isoform X1 [Drosophila mojavensis]|uniref:Uncharacterized protein, isoform A n=2 Tax=Drosophila mojavensis TaxID=7230 RepID=B4L1U6_DROMO|nr:uncharacterized protein LOC6583767 isoform X1 [Drosophila mojavensis]EDW06749.1 uncharacterized protein Dmoj_GI15235, isoform A [Drosophila mojavensis]